MPDPIDYSDILTNIVTQLQALNTNLTTLANNSTRMRNLSETSGITTRSTFDYLHVASAVKGLELDGESIGDAISAYNRAPPQTLIETDPESFPGKVAGLTWRGPWDEDRSYLINDVISLNGLHYIAIKKNKGSPPKNNQIWKLLDEHEVAKSEKAKEVWRGTWQKDKPYPAGSIVMFKDGLEQNYIDTLDDLFNVQSGSNLYRALSDIPAYNASSKKPTDPIDPNDIYIWENIDHNIIPDKATTLILSNVQFVSSSGDFICSENIMAKLAIDSPVIIEKIPYKLDDFVAMYKGGYDTNLYRNRARSIMNYYIRNDSYNVRKITNLSGVTISGNNGEFNCSASSEPISVGSEVLVTGEFEGRLFYAKTYIPNIHNTTLTDTTLRYWESTQLSATKGTWAPEKSYELNDIVTYGNSRYKCKIAYTPRRLFNVEILADGKIIYKETQTPTAINDTIYVFGSLTGLGIMESYVPSGKFYYITNISIDNLMATVTLSLSKGGNPIATSAGSVKLSGDIQYYSSPRIYKVSLTDGSTSFTLVNTDNSPLLTAIGNASGLNFVLRTTITRYGLARNPDHSGLAYWTDVSLNNNYQYNNIELNTSFFDSIIKPGYTRHLTNQKMFWPQNTGGGFFNEPPNWVASGPVPYNWTTRDLTDAAPATFPAWGSKMNQYAVWEKANVYNPIIRPITNNDGQYSLGVGKPIRINVQGGPPGSTVTVTKTSNVANMFGTGYVANTVLTGSFDLDDFGNFTDTQNFFPLLGTITFSFTFQTSNNYTLLNGTLRTYIVTVANNVIEAKLPINPTNMNYDTAKNLNLGYEFTRTVPLILPFDGTYVFQAWVDNWGKVTLDNTTILDFNNNFLDTSKPEVRSLYLRKGSHTLKIQSLNFGPQTQGNPGGIGLTISSGGSGLIYNHVGSKRYKIKNTNGKTQFRLVNMDDTAISTTLGLGAGYIFHGERVVINPELSEVGFKGCWEKSFNYVTHQMVLHKEKTWIATRDNVNNEPTPTSRYWRDITTENAAFIDDPPLFKGAWNNNITYVKNSIVSYKDRCWMSRKLVQSSPTPPPPDQVPADWQIIDDDAIYCQGADGISTIVTPPKPVIDKTLKYKGAFDTNAVYYPYDVVSIPIDTLKFIDPPIIDYSLIDSVVIKGEDPSKTEDGISNPIDEYNPALDYDLGDLVMFDDDYFVALGPVGGDLTGNNNPLNKPDLWARLMPELLPLGEIYNRNSIVPIGNTAYICVVPSTITRPSSNDWAELKPDNGLKLPRNNVEPIIKAVEEYVEGRFLNFQGQEWDWRHTYNINDVVIYNGILYRAIESSVGAVPPYNISDIDDTEYRETKWVKLEIALDVF